MGAPVEKIVGAAVAGAANTVKAVWGLVQRSKANKKIAELNENRPVYENQNIKNLVSLYQQRAGISQLPGQQNMESRMDASVASSVGQAAKYAPSSAAMLGAVTDVYGKKQEAIRDLATTFAQYKAQMQGELGQAYSVAAKDEAEAWNVNKFLPWQTKMNELVDQRQAGAEALWGGLEGIAASGFALAGSSYQGNAVGGQQQGSQMGSQAGGQIGTSSANTSAMQMNANNQKMPYNFGSNTTGAGSASSISGR